MIQILKPLESRPRLLRRVILVCVGIVLLLLVHYAPLPSDLYRESSRGLMIAFGLLIVFGWFWHWFRGQELRTRRWILPIAQFIVSLMMVPEVLIVGVPGLLGSLGMSAHLSSVPRAYLWGFAVESFSMDIALVLSLTGAVLSIVRPSRVSAWIYAAGAICYWIFIAAYIEVLWALGGGFELQYMTLWDVGPWLIGSTAALLAFALHSYLKAPTSMVCNSGAQPAS